MIDWLKGLFSGGERVDYNDLIANGARVIDVRTPGEFKGGHFKGSQNIPLQQFQQKIPHIVKKKTPVVLCCKSGMRASQAKRMLQNSGIEVHNAGSWRSL